MTKILRWPEFGPAFLLAKFGRELLPAALLAEFGDVGGVVFAVPLVEEEHPIEGADAVIGMAEGASEVGVFDGAQQADPALVETVEQDE